MMILSPQIHRTERKFLALPTPRIAPVMAWVVEMGMPPIAVPSSVIAPAVSAQNPPTGDKRVRFDPIVLTIRQPPNIVPKAMAA